MIREKRKDKHYTQEELAEKINLSPGMIGQIERGETMPSVETLDSLIDKLDIDPRSLFHETTSKDGEYMELTNVIAKMTVLQRRMLLKIAKIIREDCP